MDLGPLGTPLTGGSIRRRRGPRLHRLSPTRRFSTRAVSYARFRPLYPSAAIDAVLEGLGAPSRLQAADVGAGTGIASRLLARRRVRVTAIEPNREMRRAASPHPLIGWRRGTAERTGLPDASVDLVLSAQAFHWFRPRAALAEFHRVLRSNGRLALLWNNRDDRDPFTAAFGRLVRAAARNHPASRRSQTPHALLRSPLFRRLRRLEFPHHQLLDLSSLIGRTRSVSYLPRAGRRTSALEEALRPLVARFADGTGKVRLVFRTTLFLARRAPLSRSRAR